MASTGYHHGQPDQPGLEVMHYDLQYDTGPEVMHPPQLPSILVPNEREEKEVAQLVPVGDGRKSLFRKWGVKKSILIALCCILVIVGVVVGSVLGTQNSRALSTAANPMFKEILRKEM
ncbi:hypothetical protein F4781DRAFT_432924 [Annulohypoxylon bovei var. microspora]|nr:hypothetical protein F4781DRAFT_432924 [Annulohypoxylon bovei var. microspora]